MSTNALELGRRHRAPRRGHPGRLSGLHRRAPGSRSGGPAAAWARASPSSSPRRAGRPVRRPPPGVPARPAAGGGAHRSGQPARPARPPEGGGVRAALRAGRRVRARPRRRPARLPRRGWATSARATTAAGTGRRENFPASEISLRTAAPENVVIIDTTPDRPRVHRRGRPLLGPDARPRARHLPARVDPVPRRPARLGRAQGVRPPRRRRPLHAGRPGGDAQAARRLREPRRAPAGRRAPRRGDGRQPRHALQEAEARDGREPRLGADRPARARAADDRVLGCRRRAAAAGWRRARAGRRAARRRAGAADRRERPPHGRPARPRARQRRCARRTPSAPTVYLYEAVPGGVGLAERLWQRHDELVDGRGRPRRLLRLRARLPLVHRAATGRRGGRPRRPRVSLCACSPSSGRARAGPRARRPRRAERRSDAARLPGLRHDLAGGARAGGSRPTGRASGRAVAAPTGAPDPIARARGSPRPRPWTARLSRGERARRPGRAGGGERARSTATGWPASPASRRPTRRSSASTRRRPAWARRRARSPSSSASAGGAARVSSSSSCSSRTTPTSRRCSMPSTDALPPDAWLVTYNGRTFDWPLLVTRYRMDRRAAPALGGHLDLLPHVRRLFRHRLERRPARHRRARRARRPSGGRRRRLGDPEPVPRLRARRAGRPLAAVLTHNADDVVVARPAPRPPRRVLRGPVRPPAGAGRGPRRASPAPSPATAATDDALDCLDEADAAWRPPTLGSAAWPFGVPAPSPALLSRDADPGRAARGPCAAWVARTRRWRRGRRWPPTADATGAAGVGRGRQGPRARPARPGGRAPRGGVGRPRRGADPPPLGRRPRTSRPPSPPGSAASGAGRRPGSAAAPTA